MKWQWPEVDTVNSIDTCRPEYLCTKHGQICITENSLMYSFNCRLNLTLFAWHVQSALNIYSNRFGSSCEHNKNKFKSISNWFSLTYSRVGLKSIWNRFEWKNRHVSDLKDLNLNSFEQNFCYNCYPIASSCFEFVSTENFIICYKTEICF